LPALTLQTEAFVLTQQPPADVFQTCTLFSGRQGLLVALQRIGKKPSGKSAWLDLFDEAALILESSNQGHTWFVREARLIARATAVGRSYEALRTASALATLLLRNPVPEESRPAAADLLRSALAALGGEADPNLILFKSYYRFGRDEGYPLKEQWLASLSAEVRREAEHFLRTPAAEVEKSAENAAKISAQLGRLQDYLRGHTDILI
jgi:hypothetical protein